MSSQTIGSDFTGGALLPNYVNGRLLVAEDLATGQASLLTRDARIGQAAGTGIVHGLWVTSAATTLTIATGVGISPSGQPVVAPKTITLPLALATNTTTANTVTFSRCSGSTGGGSTTSVASGVYLLTARPVQQRQGQAPLAPPPDSTMSPGCAARWTAEGVEIRAIALPALTAVAGVAATSQNLRNLTAHWCFGTEQLVNLPVYPFSFDPAYSGFDRLDPADLTDLDVPLAVFRWTGQSVVDLDNWSARRRITTPDPVPSEWSAAVADRRDADGQARFLQFQDQIDQIAAGGTADRTMAANTFGFLPPVGFLPVRYQGGEITSTTASDPASDLTSDPASAKALALAKTAAAAGPASEFDPWFFFNGLAWFGGTINWSVADFALRQSWQLPPVPTTFNSEGRPPLTWYWIRENVNSPTARWYLVFMTDLPWQGNNDSTFTATGPPKGEAT
ncbi:hypothetical protein [Streptomyces sp. NBC_01262]|uniref:hypothetical protein n=1 Tax=Streptomyces sp. NBC_01262 TaxID=2903803 RepID=UPI002E3502DD|nr:hypothetical protein [Streptomyces sp. NBC_01262]